MKRYLIFIFDDYYAAGGMNDCIGSVDTKEELKDLINNELENEYRNPENLNIYDTKTDKIIPEEEDMDHSFELEYKYIKEKQKMELSNMEEILNLITED